ncbi:MAG: hypothetical protein P1T08_02415 [Acidimicrobiia bacterium]|nr:hypothetical protein [Acidimicrobiia bacterium]
MTRRSNILLLMVIALLFAACGSDDTGDGIATLENSTTTPAPVNTSTTTQTEFSEDQALEFSQCMRDQGLDFPDPTLDAEGNLTMDELDMMAFGSTPEEIQATLETAMTACSEYLEGVSFGGGQMPDLVELQDTFLEFTTCMRENGYDMPDPDFSTGMSGFFELGAGIDQNDPVFQAAMAQCQGIFTQLQP